MMFLVLILMLIYFYIRAVNQYVYERKSNPKIKPSFRMLNRNRTLLSIINTLLQYNYFYELLSFR